MKPLIRSSIVILFFLPHLIFSQQSGYAVQFDGVDDYLAAPDNPSWPADTNAFTAEAWVNFSSVPSGAVLIGQDEGAGSYNKWLIGYQSGKLFFHLNWPGGGSGIYPLDYPWTPSTGSFYHIAVTRQGTTYTLFINGTSVLTGTDATPIPAVTGDLTFGQAENLFFPGILDEVRIWSSARTEFDIRQWMYRSLSGSEPDLTGYWRCDDNGNSYATDLKSANNAVLMNGVQWVVSSVPFSSSSFAMVVSNAAEIHCAGSALFAAFQSMTSTDTIVVTRVPSAVQGFSPAGVTTLHAGYWVVQSTEHGSYSADLTFGLGAGALTLSDQEDPGNIKLFRRAVGSSGAWTLVGTAAAASFGSVTFNNITAFGEFAIGTSTSSPMSGTGGVFQSAASGTWHAAASWHLIGGSDEDGIPEQNDDVVIRAGDQIDCADNAYCTNLLLYGASTGTRLSLAAGIGLSLTGILNSDATALSSNLIVTGPYANVNFNGGSRQVIGNRWSGDVTGWTVNFSLNGGDTARIFTDFKAGSISVNSCWLRVGSYDVPKNLFVDGGTENSGILSVNSASLFVSGNISRTNSLTSKFNDLTASWATIELGGTYLSAEKIRFGWNEYYYSVTCGLRIRAASGLLITTGSYTHVGSLEYIGTTAQTTGNEFTSIGDLFIKNPNGVQFMTSSGTINLHLDSGNVTIPSGVAYTVTNLYGNGNEINGAGDLTVSERIETAHPDGLAGLLKNTGTQTIGGYSFTLVFKGTAAQHTGTLQQWLNAPPYQYTTITIDNPSGITLDGSYFTNGLVLANGNVTVNAPDTLAAHSLTANAGEIVGTGMYIQKSGTLSTAHASGVDGTLKLPSVFFENPNATGITFNGTVPQQSGLKLPDSLGWISFPNAAGFTLSSSLTVPGFDLNAQGSDLHIPTGVSFRTASVNGGASRKIFGGGNLIFSNTGTLTTEHPDGINGTMQLTGTMFFGDSATINLYGNITASGTLLPDTVMSLNVSTGGTTLLLSKEVAVRSSLSLSVGDVDNTTHNVTMLDGSILSRHTGSLAHVPAHQNFYDVSYSPYVGVSGNEIPDVSTVLRNFTGGSFPRMTKDMTVNGTLGLNVDADTFTVRMNGTMGPGVGVIGTLIKPMAFPGQYLWEVRAKGNAKFLPFGLDASSFDGSGTTAVTLRDTASVPLPLLPAGNRIIQYYFSAEQQGVSSLNGTVSLCYDASDVTSAGIPDEDSLSILQWNGATWIAIPVLSRDKVTKVITAGPVDTLTTFVIAGTEMKGIAVLSTNEIDFGDVVRPNVKYDSLYIKNTGTWPLSINSVSLSPDYQTFGASPRQKLIPVGDSVVCDVWFNAYHGGTTTELVFYHNGTTGMDGLTLKGRPVYPMLDATNYYPDFGTIPVGQSKKDSVIIFNFGTHPLIITSLVSEQPHFSAAMERDTIPPGDSAQMSIVFSPLSEGALTGDIIIYNNIYSSGNSYRIHASGIATASQFFVYPAQLAFGNVRRGHTAKDSVLIKNTGTAILHVSSITSTAAGFSAAPQPYEVPVNDSAWFAVTFAPQSPGAVEGEVIFHHSATTTPDSVHVTGTGIEPVFAADRSSFNFGSNVVGSTRVDSLFITNTGNAVLNIASAVSSDSVQFSVMPGSASVPPGQKQKFTLVFAPAFMGAQNAKIKFLHDGNPDTNIIAVTGFGILPVYSATRNVIDFGDIRIDSVRIDTFTVTNTGNSSLAITSVTVNDSQFTVTPASVILNSGAKKEFAVAFKPRRPRGYTTATAVFKHNGNPSVDTIRFSGTGVEPLFIASKNLIDLGLMEKDSVRSDTMSVYNPGNTDLVIDTVLFGWPTLTVSPSSCTITKGNTQTFTVVLKPQSNGTYKNQIRFLHNAMPSNDTLFVEAKVGPPALVLNKRSIQFPSLVVGKQMTDTLLVTNAGFYDLTISSIEVLNSVFKISHTSLTVAPQTGVNLVVTFVPLTAGAKSGMIIVTHDGRGLHDTVSLTGTAVGTYPIAYVHKMPNGSEAVIEGVVTRTKSALAFIQDPSGGIAVSSLSSSAWKDSLASGGVQTGDSVRIGGMLTETDFLKQITVNEGLEFVRVSRNNPLPQAQLLTLEQIRTNGENYESELVSVRSVSIILSADTVFAASRSYSIVDASDSTKSVMLRIGKAEETDIDGRKMPKNNFHFTGIVSQSHTADSAHGYQLLPIVIGDIVNDPVSVKDWMAEIPAEYMLFHNFPNPFNPSTTIRFGVPEASSVRLEVYDLLGRRVAELVNERMEAGYREVSWNAAVSTGIYLYRIESVSLADPKHRFVQVKKMLLVK